MSKRTTSVLSPGCGPDGHASGRGERCTSTPWSSGGSSFPSGVRSPPPRRPTRIDPSYSSRWPRTTGDTRLDGWGECAALGAGDYVEEDVTRAFAALERGPRPRPARGSRDDGPRACSLRAQPPAVPGLPTRRWLSPRSRWRSPTHTSGPSVAHWRRCSASSVNRSRRARWSGRTPPQRHSPRQSASWSRWDTGASR